MKIWFKLLLGIAVGVLAGFFLPLGSPLAKALSFCVQLVMRSGRFFALPLVFFSALMAFYQLHEDKILLRSVLRSLGYSVVSCLGLSLLAVVFVLVAHPQVVRLGIGDMGPAMAFDPKAFLLSLFPPSLPELFSSAGFLAPTVFLALIMALIMVAEKSNAKPFLMLSDSLSHLLYHLNSYYVEFLSLGLSVLAASAELQLREIYRQGRLAPYAGFIWTLLALGGFVALVVVPLSLFACGFRRRPYKWVYALLAPFLSGLLSGDAVFSLGILFKHSKENLGIRRRSNAQSLPIQAIFGRAGSAMVAAASFVFVYECYSGLGFSIIQFAWLLPCTVLASVLASAMPDRAAFGTITALCLLFGRGFELSYKIVEPIAIIIVAVGAGLDMLVLGALSLIQAKRQDMRSDREARFFI